MLAKNTRVRATRDLGPYNGVTIVAGRMGTIVVVYSPQASYLVDFDGDVEHRMVDDDGSVVAVEPP